ncbi:MAG: HU family DNA-binding protein [Desulfovibrionaceae bacterium]|nr:HU family DNA-binding protein [Desulfovibrionaceae bacterium]MBO4793481.1 HU family DNA-binding protein [Deltaproteobacteria bacterium]MBR5734618.1 HU family DNA-binding protein [Desulfovibrionaceae bacterium]
MTKAELVAQIFEKSGLASKALTEKALNAVVETLAEALAKGETVSLAGFGTFKISERAARKGRNPRTGQEIEIAASKTVRFVPGKALKDSVK